MSTAKPRLLALDWGTSQLRAYLVGADGSVLAHRDGGPGILAVEPGGFPTALRAFAGDWLAETPCALASGMVGSRQGWHEVPYARCPAGLAELTAGLAEVDAGEGATVQLVPGLTCETDNAIPDVMRGEETQLLGALGERAGQDGGQPRVHLPEGHPQLVLMLGLSARSDLRSLQAEHVNRHPAHREHHRSGARGEDEPPPSMRPHHVTTATSLASM